MDSLEVGSWDSDFRWQPSYNIYPTQEIPVLTFKNKRTIQSMHWGLIPYWSKDSNVGSRMINARSETLTEKPAYGKLVKSHRCIIIASGYYDWKQTSQGKVPYYIFDPENIFGESLFVDPSESVKRGILISQNVAAIRIKEEYKDKIDFDFLVHCAFEQIHHVHFLGNYHTNKRISIKS